MEGIIKHEKLTYNVAEAAEAIGVSVSKMYQVIKMDGFPLVTLGGRRLIPIKKFEQWIEAMAGSPALEKGA